PCYANFRALDIINPHGDINPMAWNAMKSAILHPHREAHRNHHRSETRHEEKENKRRCLEEALPDDIYTLPVAETSRKAKGKAPANERASEADTPRDMEQ
ncbi:hypothetical protein H0H87_002474, partial [Tephrocybe sp. NHM501043]